MSKFDKTQSDACEEQQQQVTGCAEQTAAAMAEEGESVEFKISVRKVPMKVQARGVLAE
jgi:hypothetical protein